MEMFYLKKRGAGDVAAGLAGPVPLTAFDILLVLVMVFVVKVVKQVKAAYRAIQKSNIPFLNIFYIKSAYDYIIRSSVNGNNESGCVKKSGKKNEKRL